MGPNVISLTESHGWLLVLDSSSVGLINSAKFADEVLDSSLCQMSDIGQQASSRKSSR